MTMTVKITLTGPGGELETIILDNIADEFDPKINTAVRDLASHTTWCPGDTLKIQEIVD